MPTRLEVFEAWFDKAFPRTGREHLRPRREPDERLSVGSAGIFGSRGRVPAGVGTLSPPVRRGENFAHSRPADGRPVLDRQPIIEGLAVPFDALSELRYSKRRLHPEGKPYQLLFRRGAFASALRSDRDRVALLEHDRDRVLAHSWNGNLRFWETDAGLMFRFVARTELGLYAAYAADAGKLLGASIEYAATAGDWALAPDGGPLRVVREADVNEVSLLRNPAFPGTYLKVRW